MLHTDRERRDGEREFRGRDDGDDKTLGDWRRKEDTGGRDRRGMCMCVLYYCLVFAVLCGLCSVIDTSSGEGG